MKILLIGNGAREHAIAKALKKSPKCEELIVYAKAVNPGIRDLASIYHVGDLADMNAIRDFADQNKPDFCVVGPDNPIADGATDALMEVKIPSIAPPRKLAKLESSKSFARELLAKYKVPGGPIFKTFTSNEGMMAFAEKLGEIVVKADGLKGGKGVQVMGDHFETLEQGILYAQQCIKEDGHVVIEEKFVGQEFSLMSFIDGETVVDMPVIQDHKRAYEDDKGPNTGGMGTYSDIHHLPFLSDKDVADAHDISVKTIKALQEETGGTFKGILFGGFIAVKEGVRLIEYNVRFGDPEAMNALILLETDFVTICQAIINGTLDQLEIKFSKKATVCKYIVPDGYPIDPKKGEQIHVGKIPDGVEMYYSSVDDIDGNLVMSSSRALAFIAKANSLEEAEQLAQKGVESVEGPVFYRKDIGTKKVIEKKVKIMKEIRGL